MMVHLLGTADLLGRNARYAIRAEHLWLNPVGCSSMYAMGIFDEQDNRPSGLSELARCISKAN